MTNSLKSQGSDNNEPPEPLKQAPQFKGLKKMFGKGEASVLAQASSVGISFAVAIVIGLFTGRWLDSKLGTAPWLLLVGLLIGIVAGFRNLFVLSARLDRKAKEDQDTKKQVDKNGK